MNERFDRDRPGEWQRELQRTSSCVPIERFGEALTAAEADHVSHCARCEAEFALWREFERAEPTSDEGGAVNWIVAELRRRAAGNPAPTETRTSSWHSWIRTTNARTMLAVAATLVVVVSIGYMVRDREPAIEIGTSPNVYRSTTIQNLEPSGDLGAPPSELKWSPVTNASRYDVKVVEVDRSVLWRASASEPRVELPPTVVAQFVPGKTILWQVEAVDARGATVADSGVQRFRVVQPAPPPRE